MPTLQQKIDKRANIWEQMKAVMDRRSDGLTAEDLQSYDRAEKEYDTLDAEINAEEAFVRREAAIDALTGTMSEPTPVPKDPADRAYASAFNRWMRGGNEVLDTDERGALRAGWVDGQALNAAGAGTGAAGGYTVPPEFRAKLIEVINFVATMRQDAEVITTDTGATLPWPTNDDTANEGAILAENTQVTEQDFTFGQGSIDAYMYTSKLVRVSLQLLNDSAFNLDQWLATALGRRIGRVQQRHFTVGTGTGQPDGLFTTAAVGVNAGSSTAVTTDNLIDLQESVDASILEGGNCVWEFNQTIRGALRKLKDSQNRYIWEPSLQAGGASTLLGAPVRLNNYVDTFGVNKKPIGFGDKRQAYLIRDVNEVTLLRLAERYADYLQVGFIAFQRSDGTTQMPSAFKTLQLAAS